MKIEKKLNKHNNMVIKLHDDTDGTIFSRTGERFSYKTTNMFLTEMKVNDPNKPKKNKKRIYYINKTRWST
jgi:hypothetical protein